MKNINKLDKLTKSIQSTQSTQSTQSIKNNDVTAYIIVNSSLGMSKGKIASQTAHGILDVYRFLLKYNIDYSKWIYNGEKIVVVKATSDQIKQIIANYSDKIPETNRFNIFPIYDNGNTEVEFNSLTILATTPISNDKKPDFIKNLKLL